MRRSAIRVITAISCLFLGSAAWRLSPFYSGSTAHAQTAQAEQAKPGVTTAQSSNPSAKLKPAKATVPSATNLKTTDLKTSKPALPLPTAAPGTEIYTAKRGEAIPTIAHRYLGRTSYLTSTELSEAIRAINNKPATANILKANEQIVIPGILAAPIVEKTISVPKDFEVRAIYLTGIMAASDHGLRIIRHWREVGGNAVVFDIKDSDGSVNIPFEHPLLGEHKVYIHDVPKLLRFIHQQNMHAIARIAIFRDERLVTTHPELAVQSHKNHTPWRENGKLVWTDSSNPKVQDYNIALAKHVAELGADEIQFDYVRFPAEGDQKDASFVFQNEPPEAAQAAAANQQDAGSNNSPCGDGRLARPAEAKQGGTSISADVTASLNSSPVVTTDNSPGRKPRVAIKNGYKSRRDDTKSACHVTQRSDVITAFLKKAYAEIHPTGALLSLDVFGVMAWQRPVDLSHTGQDIVGMAKYCDVLSPMIYPSHFFGMDNIARPGDEPAHFIGESMDRFQLITKGSGVVIRPWLQAFHWRTRTYSPEYIKVQVATAKEKGGIGFLFWNAANDYSKPYTAMPEMKAADLKEGSKDKAKFFRGDELPGATSIHAALTPTN